MLKILTVNPQNYQDSILELFEEYLRGNQQAIAASLKIHFDLDSLLKEEPQNLSQFFPPNGFFLGVKHHLKLIGCAGLRPLNSQVCEIKRVYVKPEYRRQGIGRLLIKTLLEEAKNRDYHSVRLDCFRGFVAAQNLYKSLGFQEIKPDLESEIPPQYYQHWMFMEHQLN
ncbi:MAG: GNAT family N-acetyltransferase [Lyngbya sp.]|nr:GNAT family N-acetyltransferase [Lyngbya sp.]